MSNIFSFTGTLGRDSEVRQLPSGVSILNFTVANNVGYGDKQKTLWVRVAVFGKRAEGRLSEFLVKGTKVFVSGELSQNEYQANDGSTKTSLDLNANVIDLIGGGKRDDNQQQSQQQQQQSQKNQQTEEYENFDDDIPF